MTDMDQPPGGATPTGGTTPPARPGADPANGGTASGGHPSQPPRRGTDGAVPWSQRRPPTGSYDSKVLLHELSVHQAELEQQNEELRRMQVELDSERERYRLLYELAPVGLLTIDRAGIVLSANRILAEACGRKRDALTARPVEQILEASSRPTFAARLRELFVRGQAVQWECLLTTGEGRPAQMQVDACLVSDPTAGGAACALIALTDVSARARTIAALETARSEALEAARVKAHLLANVSHEMRTPLTSVIGVLDLLRLSQPPKDQGEMLESARGSADTLLRLIEDLLDSARLEAGRLKLQRSACDLVTLATSVVRGQATAAAARGLSLALDFNQPALPQVEADGVRLRQILGNLVANAVKFTERGHIAVSVDLSRAGADGRGLCRFMVTDTGPGIASAAQNRLFTPFSQVEVGSTRRTTGAGLGLSIVRELVQLMDGHIDLTSTPGVGSCFSVALPLPITSVPSPPPRLLDGWRVVVASPTAAVRRGPARWAAAWGGQVHEAGSVAALVRAVSSGSEPLVVIADLQDPLLSPADLADASATIPGGRRRILIAIGRNGQIDGVPLVAPPADPSRLLAVLGEALHATPVTEGRHLGIGQPEDPLQPVLATSQPSLIAGPGLQQTVLDALSQEIAIIDRTGTIISVNKAWSDFAHSNGGAQDRCGVGSNYLSICWQAAQDADPGSVRILEGLRAVLSGDIQHFTEEYPCHAPTEERWFLLSASAIVPTGAQRPLGAVLTHLDISRRVRAEQSLQAVSNELLSGMRDPRYVAGLLQTGTPPVPPRPGAAGATRPPPPSPPVSS